MNPFFSTKTLLLVVFLQTSSMLFGQGKGYYVSKYIYVSCTQELPSSKNTNITKISRYAYIMPAVKLPDLRLDTSLYVSPIWKNDLTRDEYAIDNSIILYNVPNLDELIHIFNLTPYVISTNRLVGSPSIYVLSLRNYSHEQIISLCATLQSSQYCQFAEPNRVTFNRQPDDITPDPSYNEFYSDQWGLHKTMSSDYNINARTAWRISTGANIKVAVVDVGFELQHPDLVNNIAGSYDCTDGADGSSNGAYMLNKDSHGTQCAGVVCAANNNIGIIGVAPESELILIRRAYSRQIGDSIIFISYSSWDINALRTAYELEADVISNSWSTYSNSNNYNTLDAVLLEAHTYGRDGKGCVAVFSTGNASQNYIHYPSNSPYTISVGAINEYGVRPSWSNYGDNLDIVAPGVDIKTTQIVPYGTYCYSSGTSMAAPMVAGVAALILSVNPDISSTEVRKFICSTAYKLPSYSFDSTAVNGKWNNEVGYGLVNAYAAVLSAAGGYIQGPDYVCDTTKYYLIQPSQSGEMVTWSVYNNNDKYPHYSIIGANFLDTVYVRCNYGPGGLAKSDSMQYRPLDPLQPFIPRQYLSVSISNIDTTITYQKTFRTPTGDIPIFSPTGTVLPWVTGTPRSFTVTNCTGVPDTAFDWEVMKRVFNPNNNRSIDTTYEYFCCRRTLTYTPTLPSNVLGTVTITAINTQKECGNQRSESQQYGISPSNMKVGLSASIEGNQLVITCSEESDSPNVQSGLREDNSNSTLELWHSIYGCVRTKVATSTIEYMDISNLPPGVYVLLQKEGGIIIAEKKVIID